MTDQRQWRQEGDSSGWNVISSRVSIPSALQYNVQYDHCNLASEGRIREQEVLQLISYHWHSPAGCCHGSAIHAGAQEAIRGLILWERQSHGD